MGRKSSTRLAILGVAISAFLAFATTAVAQVMPAEVSAYKKAFDVAPAIAEDRLETQEAGTEADLVGTLEQSLGDDYAGLWFDNASGEFVVPLADGGGRKITSAVATGAGLAGDYRTAAVDDSWGGLEAAQARLDTALHDLIAASLVQTSLDPRTNAVVIDLADAASGQDAATIEQLAAQAGVDVELRGSEEQRFEVEARACRVQYFPSEEGKYPHSPERYCGKPLRGGVALNHHLKPEYSCTVGFRAKGTNGKRYVLTAGHCAGSGPVVNWDSADQTKNAEDKPNLQYIGELEQYKFPGNDWAKINATSSYWDTNPWPSTIAYWGQDESETKTKVLNESYPINGESSAYIGQTVCHSGATTGTSCGTISAVNMTISLLGGGVVEHETQVKGGCDGEGDSGGPVFASNMALGLFSAGDENLYTAVKIWCKEAVWYYTDIREATRDLDVHIYPSIETVPTETQIDSATALNGNPGWFSIKGKVSSSGSLAGTHVIVKLFKWIGSSWSEQAKLEPSVNSGTYEVNNWFGVGPGQWLAKVVFPAQNGLGESTSDETDEGWFEVKDGYRLVARHDGKCLEVGGGNTANGATLNQWDCLDPASYPHQVFTLRPTGNYYELIARHSGRCIDVTGDGRGDGTRLQQWECNGYGQQKWETKGVETYNGALYAQYIGKNSGRCMEVMGGLGENGTPVQQWGCGGGLHQRWKLQSVNSAPVPTYSTINLGEVLNGEWGFADVSGHVDVGTYVGGVRYVNVNFQKLINGAWTTQNTWYPNLDANGYWSVQNGEFGHPGTWRVRAVYPGEPAEKGLPALAESKSPYTQEFTIKRGYRLYNRYAGKCLTASGGNIWQNATAIVLMPCAATATPGDGQMLTFVPQPNGWIHLVFNNNSNYNTGRCVDVAGASMEPGMWTHTWDCGSGANQQWNGIPIQNQSPWVAFQVLHSGQCLDNRGPSTNNGTTIQQYHCIWTGGQQWKIESVG